ncbi:calcium-dependent phosphotriesterase [Basidiobolus meristosporus CBS 931.73]|uniref:Calcium-dependent phosphotriesterase n=1 Tax=Basidiobolus meristosporus CBS 931.73 TaxID=1314790 RepID=A0A1Y1Y0X7_9FUNG|nr:calcium-dependent phosphotriesterase [Basidiobolus meristosporus CBS 931.73]|eukprot:ORX91284.1 calcium-dependent phosphotriesterase [Basidiobolus meristosporus CBS 931.73]
MLSFKPHSMLYLLWALGINAAASQYNAKALINQNSSKFGPLIEGAGVDQNGNIYAVNFGTSTSLATLGQITPNQKLFYEDKATQGTAFNAIRFQKGNQTVAFAADYVNHRIVRLTVNGGTITAKNHCSSPNILQPNDLALSKSGLLFLSGMKWQSNGVTGDGDLWVCSAEGTPRRLDLLGRTNGIELSPDDKYLYLSEAVNQNGTPVSNKIWRYLVNPQTGDVSNKTLFFDFAQDQSQSIDIDGMRTDIAGNLFVTRNGGQKVVVISPSGQLLSIIKTTFTAPTNLEFGGPLGKTLHIVGRCGINTPGGQGAGCVDTWENNVPGRAWTLLQN